MPLSAVEKNQEILSLALEDRSSGYQDLVSNSNPLLLLMQRKGKFKPYSGPRIRERLLYNKTGSAVWYNGYDFLNPVPAELFNDAEYTPKMVAVAVVLTNEEILNNDGKNQILDVMESHINAAERELVDEVDLSIHGNGTRFNGKELTGLQAAVPVVTNSGVYGGIDRATQPLWRTYSFDANSAFPDIGTQVNSTTIRPMINRIFNQRMRGTQRADLLLMSPEHFAAYDAATVAIQRITDERGQLGKFSTLKYYGVGGSADIVNGGGIGSNMPANTTYGLDTDNLWMRYHPERNFDKIGRAMMPVNQDAVVQYIGFMGELTMTNPLFQWRLYDSNPAA